MLKDLSQLESYCYNKLQITSFSKKLYLEIVNDSVNQNALKPFHGYNMTSRKIEFFCHFCTSHEDKLLEEHNKDSAYTSTNFNNWKKAPKCFKTHENSKCHEATLTNQVAVPKCRDVVELVNKDLVKQRSNDRQYLKMVIQCLQFLGRQGIAVRGNDDGNDNLAQLLLLRGKDHPHVIQRLQSKEYSKKLYTHHDYEMNMSKSWSIRFYGKSSQR